MSLSERLAALKQARMSGRVRAGYEDFMAMMDHAEVAAHALKAGEAMPEFLLPNAEGGLVASADLLAAGPLVVTFFRGDWCPYCILALSALEEALPDIHALGATLVAMTPDTGGRALRAKLRHGLHYEVLSDVDNAVAMQFGIVVSLPESYRSLLRQAGVDLTESHGNAGWFIPVPATYLVGQDGQVLQAWVDTDFTSRTEPAVILAALRSATDRRPVPLAADPAS